MVILENSPSQFTDGDKLTSRDNMSAKWYLLKQLDWSKQYIYRRCWIKWMLINIWYLNNLDLMVHIINTWWILGQTSRKDIGAKHFSPYSLTDTRYPWKKVFWRIWYFTLELENIKRQKYKWTSKQKQHLCNTRIFS